jgi:hypothetical protein
MNMKSSTIATTTIIHRPFGDAIEYRRVADPACRAEVHAFPMTELSAVSNAGLIKGPGAYALTDGYVVYFGESYRPLNRLTRHATDPSKPYAKHIYVVAGCFGSPFDKSLVLDFEYRLTSQAIEAGVATVAKGSSPTPPELTGPDRSTHDRIYADALRLLVDAGCRLFHKASPESPGLPDAENDVVDGEDMSIGFGTAPLGAEEFELRYLGLWARGYWSGNRFIVAAGSEVRYQTNDSVDVMTRQRREELDSAGVLAGIPGVSDRRRLIVALSFPSPSIAAKVACGAHTPGRWASLSGSSPVVLAP